MIISDKMVKSQEQKRKYNNYILKRPEPRTEDFEILHDVTKAGKDRKWKERKEASIRHANRMEKLGYKDSVVERSMSCAEILKFHADPIKGLKLYQAFFCKNKLCPMCNWRRSMKYSWQSKEILTEALKRRPRARFLFLTLTIKNVPAEELSDAIKEMNIGFNRAFRRKLVNKNLIGYIRSLEVTYNDETGLYHPHIHVLLMVSPAYFNSKENYISQADWTEIWKQSAKLDYTPVVDIRAVKEKVAKGDLKNDFSDDGIMKAVLETAKYPVKPFEIEKDKNGKIVKRSEEKLTQITGELLEGLYKKRQLGFGGLLKEIRKELQLDDVENGDLVNTSDEDKPKASKAEIIVAYWNYSKGNYFIKQ